MKKVLEIIPIFGVEHDAILSNQGDITIAYVVTLPELFTLSVQKYEALHHVLIKAITILPKHATFHKQDWFTATTYMADFCRVDQGFLTRRSERFFHERPYLHHQCYMMLTKKATGRKLGSSLFSNLPRRPILPEQILNPQLLQDFLDRAEQFEHSR